MCPFNLPNYFTYFHYRFEDMWKFKDDPDNPHERYYKDIIEREKMVKIEQEIRNIVDEIMRSELELLQAAFDKDRAFKGKKSKKPQKKVNFKPDKIRHREKNHAKCFIILIR